MKGLMATEIDRLMNDWLDGWLDGLLDKSEA